MTIRFVGTVSLCTALLVSGAALAQTPPAPSLSAPVPTTPFGQVQTAPRGELASPPPVTADGAVVTTVPATSEPAQQASPPVTPATANTERIFLDTRVSDVRVGNDMTVATMAQSPESQCPSNEYVFERNRAKWLFQTGRLMLAMKEGAIVRISFTCLEGYQSINAIQFLSPAPAVVATGTPRPGEVVRVAPQPAAARPGAIPPPTPAADRAQPLDQRIRTIPMP